ncbi:uncharacterized protein LOC134841478 [Symsagittifera roscoffensis]|uniref:uncharacterized protein LOC134841478 n=1 Tax=Symsagittifera roscoffensis TaxID=84072 RepID=UPI00307C1AA8
MKPTTLSSSVMSSPVNFCSAMWLFVAVMILLAATVSSSRFDPEDNKRMYRGIGKRESSYGGVEWVYPTYEEEFEPSQKRLKMPLVYKRLKIFGQQTQPRPY